MAIAPQTDRTDPTREEPDVPALLRFIRPRPEELRWQAIPWQTDLREACRLASEQGKPIFLWTMNGNPLGCT
jgi:hypothetical protein